MLVLLTLACLGSAQGADLPPDPLPAAPQPLRYRSLRTFELVSLGTLGVGAGFFAYGVTRAGQNSGNASLQYLGIGAVGGGLAVVGLGLSWLSTGLAARRLRGDGALARRWALAGSLASGVLAVGLGATRNTLPWTDQGQVWVDQGFTASILATAALVGGQIALNELAWWDHRADVALAPWWTPESSGVALALEF